MSLYESEVAYSAEYDPYLGVLPEVRESSAYRYRTTPVEQPKTANPKRARGGNLAIAVLVLVIGVCAAVAGWVITSDRPAPKPPVVHVAPKTFHVTHLKYWVHIGQSSLRIEV